MTCAELGLNAANLLLPQSTNLPHRVHTAPLVVMETQLRALLHSGFESLSMAIFEI